jgi:hypothetical protein
MYKIYAFLLHYTLATIKRKYAKITELIHSKYFYEQKIE